MRSRLIVVAALALACAAVWPAAALAAPGHDSFPGQTVAGSVVEVSGSTVGATVQASEPDYMYYSNTGTVWYSWTAPASGTVLVRTGGSDFSPTIAVYTGSVINGLSFVAGNQRQYESGSLEFDADAGTTYRFQVGGYGNATGHLEFQLIQDTASPTIGAPTHAFALGSEQYGDQVPLTFSWTQADSGGSGICQVNLRYSQDGGPFQVTYGYNHDVEWFSPGHGYRWGVQAIDCAHNASGWVAGPTVTLKAVDQTAATFTKSWNLVTGSAFFGNTDRYSAVQGASATFKITARSIAVLAPKGPNRGSMDIFVDGKLFTTVSLVNRYGTSSQIVARKAFTASGAHTVKLVAHAAKRVDADAVAGMSW
jgi:hypothetical protein